MQVVGAVIVRDARVLVGRRREGGWEFPGGKLEPDESAAAALVRECREELGVEVRAVREVGATSDGEVALQLWLAELVSSPPSASTDHDQLRWVALDELDALDWLPLDAELLSLIRPLLS